MKFFVLNIFTIFQIPGKAYINIFCKLQIHDFFRKKDVIVSLANKKMRDKKGNGG